MSPCLGSRYQQQKGGLDRRRGPVISSPHKFIRACITLQDKDTITLLIADNKMVDYVHKRIKL